MISNSMSSVLLAMMVLPFVGWGAAGAGRFSGGPAPTARLLAELHGATVRQLRVAVLPDLGHRLADTVRPPAAGVRRLLDRVGHVLVDLVEVLAQLLDTREHRILLR